MPKPFPSASSSFEDGSYQPFDGSFVLMPSNLLMPLEPNARLLPEMVDEDIQYSNFLEVELPQEENCEADFTGNGDNGNLAPPLSGEDAKYVDFLEAELLVEENNEALNDKVLSSTGNVNDALPPTWSNEDAEFQMEFVKVGVKHNEALYIDMVLDIMAEMVSDSTFDNVEVVYGALALENPIASSSES